MVKREFMAFITGLLQSRLINIQTNIQGSIAQKDLTNAEHIVYALFNCKGICLLNSCPVGSDMMFEVYDGYIHIHLKTVQTRNIGDYGNHIVVGENQNSYNYYINASGKKREYTPNLPHYYNIKNFHKPCLKYFVQFYMKI